MIGETNINGGAGLNGKGALLEIYAANDSIVTVSKENYSKTIKTSEIDSENNQRSVWLFETNNFGEWTITVTLDNVTDTRSILINNNKKYTINFFKYYLMRDGVIINSTLEIFGNATLTQKTGFCTLQTTSNNSGSLRSINNIDLAPYSMIVLDLSSGSRSWSGGDNLPSIGYGADIYLSQDFFYNIYGCTTLAMTTGNIDEGQYIADISSITLPYQIICTVGGTRSFTDRVGYLNIINIYLI